MDVRQEVGTVLGVEFSDNDMYTELMAKEDEIMTKLNALSERQTAKSAFEKTFFSMNLQTFVVDFLSNISSIVKKMFTSKKWTLTNKETFYLGILIVIVSGFIVLCES